MNDKTNIIKLIEKTESSAYVTPEQLLEEALEKGRYSKCDSLLIIGIKNDVDNFAIMRSSIAKMKSSDIVVACELMKDYAIKQLLGDR